MRESESKGGEQAHNGMLPLSTTSKPRGHSAKHLRDLKHTLLAALGQQVSSHEFQPGMLPLSTALYPGEHSCQHLSLW